MYCSLFLCNTTIGFKLLGGVFALQAEFLSGIQARTHTCSLKHVESSFECFLGKRCRVPLECFSWSSNAIITVGPCVAFCLGPAMLNRVQLTMVF